MRFGLLGETLKHSFSPEIHSELADYSYELFERKPEEIAALVKDESIGGFNITIPYKEEIMQYCDEISEDAKKIGCINTLVHRDDKTLGYNTDYSGFVYMVKNSRIEPRDKSVLILGDGATSKTVEHAMMDLGAREVVKLSRKGEHKFEDAPSFSHFQIIVNCTPVGMYPNNLQELVDLSLFFALEGVLDLIYNPHRTLLLLKAMEMGVKYSDGLPMLVAQAKYAAEIFLNREIEDYKIRAIEKILRRDMESIVLIGMPGCGKTTIGRELAAQLNREFIDIDQEIVKKHGVIENIFSDKGEPYFRALESLELAEHGKKSGVIIATGGGIVKNKENYYPLKQNSRIYFIKRDLELLPVKGRPLSQGGLDTLKVLYKERLPLYKDFSDKIIESTGFINKTAKLIVEDFNANISN